MKEFYLQPELISAMKTYSKAQFVKDLVAGLIVAIIALPLSIALALASGVAPACGIYTAIAAGFVVSLLGGSRVQIAGPTAAFATVVAGVVAVSFAASLAASVAPLFSAVGEGVRTIVLTLAISAAAAVLFPCSEDDAEAGEA